MIRFQNMRRLALAYACAIAMPLLPCIPAANAQDIIDSWKSVTVPAPPELQSVTVDSAQTALLILDMYATSCSEDQRPSCVRSIPYVQRLLAEARAHKMMIVYSAGPPTANGPTKPTDALASLPGEQTVRAGADKWLDSGLDKILAAGKIKRVIVVGTSANGSVLYTASGAALRNMMAIVPVDGISAANSFAELLTVWHLKNAPSTVSANVILTRTNLITIR
jgi:nicotinamidase-related amidase